jgi:hypothetical protein
MAESQDVIPIKDSDVLAPVDLREALPRFQSAWNKTRDALFDLLELIAEYKDRPKFEALCEELERKGIIKRSVMSMLETIAANPVLMRPDYRKQMPSSYNTLWLLTSVDEKVLARKIERKEIEPNLTVEDARAIKLAAGPKSTGPRKPLPKLIAAIRMSAAGAKRNRDDINRHLRAIERLGATVAYSDVLAE